MDNHLSGRQHEMKIDPNATVHLMSLLTALYSDQELACIREYSTNANDSHMDAGQKRPIEVTTPTSLFPYLRIKDFGVGMNANTIEHVYSQYGRSTKREQTNTNGSMGIGGKSALSYTNQFSVVGVKDSIKTHVSVSIGADSGGIMEIVDESLTDEHDGVEIVIPAKRFNGFGEKAQNFFKFWAPGTVLLNGKDPSGAKHKVSKHIYVMDETDYYGGDVIVMGNVAYPVKDGLSGGDSVHKYGRRVNLVAFVTMNTPDEVVFTPSREGLIYTPQTNRVIEELKAEYRTAVIQKINDAMTNATSFGEAYKAYVEFEHTYAPALLANITFRGLNMPVGYIKEPVDPNDATKVKTARATIWSTNNYRYSVQTGRDLSFESIMSHMIVKNYPSATGVSGTHKAKVRAYLEDNNIRSSNVIFLPTDHIPGAPWTAEANVVDWSDIKAIKLNTSNSNYTSKSYGGGYEVFNASTGLYVLTHDLAATSKIIYYSKVKNGGNYLAPVEAEMMMKYLPDSIVVECSTNRFDKLQRLFPKALTVYQARFATAIAVVDGLTDLEKEQIKMQSVHHLDYLRGIDYTMINDPFLSRAVEVYRMTNTAGTLAFARISSAARDKAIIAIGKPELEDVQSRYPLLSWTGSDRADVLIYINAKYATLPKGN